MSMPSGRQPEPGRYARAFSAHVRQVMASTGVTASALAVTTGMSRNYLGKRLRDEVPFTLNDVEVISAALGIELPQV
jgi:DNA-binding phage protein